MNWRTQALIGGFLFSFISVNVAVAQNTKDYVLGPEDKLKIAVYEWRPARNEAYEWSALKGEFTVGPDGMLSLPLIGQVQVAKLKVADISSIISDKLQSKFGLTQRPDAAVEISHFRPFYIVGYVNRPGSYEFKPDLNALQAIAVAGGLFRPESNLNGYRRDNITQTGDLQVNRLELMQLVARKARLQAEIDGSQKIAFPAEFKTLKPAERLESVAAEEEKLFNSRMVSLQTQIESLTQVKALLLKEIDAVKTKQVTQDRQVELAQRELEGVNTLASKGLAVSARQISVEQMVAQLTSLKQDLKLTEIRLRQDVSKADRDMQDLRDTRRMEDLKVLQEVDANIQKIRRRMAVNEELIDNGQADMSRKMRNGQTDTSLPAVVAIDRVVSGKIQQILADASTKIMPGDTIRVLKLPSDSEDQAAN